MNRSILCALAATACVLLSALPSQAQVNVAPPSPGNPNPTGGYGYNYPQQQQPGSGPPPGFGPGPGYGQPGFGQPGPGQPGGRPPAPQLPDGVDKLYALETNNSLVLLGTQDGYSSVRELVRGLDGDLDIIRTQVALVKITREALPGRTLTGDTLTPGDLQILLTARLAGQLPATATVRMTTGEDEEIATTLGKRDNVPVSFIPRLGAGGRIALQMAEPLDTTITIRSGGTTALALPRRAGAAPDAPFSVLFITPGVVTRSARR